MIFLNHWFFKFWIRHLVHLIIFTRFIGLYSALVLVPFFQFWHCLVTRQLGTCRAKKQWCVSRRKKYYMMGNRLCRLMIDAFYCSLVSYFPRRTHRSWDILRKQIFDLFFQRGIIPDGHDIRFPILQKVSNVFQEQNVLEIEPLSAAEPYPSLLSSDSEVD